MLKIKGLKKFESEFKKLKSNNKKLQNTTQVSFSDLFSIDFMKNNTNFDNINDFFYYFNIKVNNQVEFNLLDEALLDEAVNRFTDFNSWEEMVDEANLKYIEKKLFEGIKL